jgi:hypothetical protein
MASLVDELEYSTVITFSGAAEESGYPAIW